MEDLGIIHAVPRVLWVQAWQTWACFESVGDLPPLPLACGWVSPQHNPTQSVQNSEWPSVLVQECRLSFLKENTVFTKKNEHRKHGYRRWHGAFKVVDCPLRTNKGCHSLPWNRLQKHLGVPICQCHLLSHQRPVDDGACYQTTLSSSFTDGCRTNRTNKSASNGSRRNKRETIMCVT